MEVNCVFLWRDKEGIKLIGDIFTEDLLDLFAEWFIHLFQVEVGKWRCGESSHDFASHVLFVEPSVKYFEEGYWSQFVNGGEGGYVSTNLFVNL
jgi:hypothetical protein